MLDGMGMTWMQNRTCERCDGEGVVEEKLYSPGWNDLGREVFCPDCMGKGWLVDEYGDED